MIKEIIDYNEALKLIEESYETIKEEDSIEGQRAFINDFLYSDETYDQINNKEMIIYGYYDNDILAGFGSIDNDNYIKFLFVDKKYTHNNIGTMLLDYLCEIGRKRKKPIRLDSSISAVKFYKSYGFKEIDGICLFNGMKYIPMIKE